MGFLSNSLAFENVGLTFLYLFIMLAFSFESIGSAFMAMIRIFAVVASCLISFDKYNHFRLSCLSRLIFVFSALLMLCFLKTE